MATVYFDLDGTLVEFDRPYAALFPDVCDAAGVPYSDALFEDYSEAFFAALRRADPAPYETGAREAFAEHGVDADPAAFAQTAIDVEVAATVRRPGVTRALDQLAETDHSLGVLTNGVGTVQRQKLDAVSLLDRFDDVYCPFEDGHLKPDHAAFEAAKRRLPGETYHLFGDSREDDVEAGRAAGFRAVHVAREDRLDGLIADAGLLSTP